MPKPPKTLNLPSQWIHLIMMKMIAWVYLIGLKEIIKKIIQEDLQATIWIEQTTIKNLNAILPLKNKYRKSRSQLSIRSQLTWTRRIPCCHRISMRWLPIHKTLRQKNQVINIAGFKIIMIIMRVKATITNIVKLIIILMKKPKKLTKIKKVIMFHLIFQRWGC